MASRAVNSIDAHLIAHLIDARHSVTLGAMLPVMREGVRDAAHRSARGFTAGSATGLKAVACLALAGLALGCAEDTRPVPDGPSVILISVDTLRADRLGLYGHSRDTTPWLERLASDAIVFDRAYHNGGGTLPSHATMLTSLHPRTHQVAPDTGRVLQEERTTLAEVFHRHGWDTGAFVDGGWMSELFGFGQGFDVFENVEGGGLEELLPMAERWLGRQRERPAFLFLHTYDVHSKTDRLPYECPDDGHWTYAEPGSAPSGFDGCRDGRCASELLAHLDARLAAGDAGAEQVLSESDLEWMRTLYDGCVLWTDARLGDFARRLDEMGHYDPSILVVTTDHGEEFLDHGRLLHHQYGFDETARVPLVIKLPDGRSGGQRVDRLAATVDLLPTLLDYAGLPAPGEAQGVSLRPAIEDGLAARSDLHVYSVLRSSSSTVDLPGDVKFFAETGLAYDLSRDPDELHPLDLSPETRQQLKERLWGLVREDVELQETLDAGGVVDGVELSDEERQRLEALGYLQ